MRKILHTICLFLLGYFGSAGASPTPDEVLREIVQRDHRSQENKARDAYRHPVETLSFFGVQENETVLEILPGKGWYTEILAPYLREEGKLIVANFGADYPNSYLVKKAQKFSATMQQTPSVYGQVRLASFGSGGNYLPEIQDNSVDTVLTFRSTHNWIRHGNAEKIYQAFFRILKHGGTLGIVQHRANLSPANAEEPIALAKNGYVQEDYLILLAEKIGFRLEEKSEINANQLDTKDYPKGVWSLPPTLRLKDENRKKYLAVGESDRMTLHFVKP